MTEPFRPIFPTHIDNTMLTLYKACPHKFWLQQLRGIQSPYPNIHLHFGGVFAKACEVTRRAYFARGVAAEEAIEQGEHYILENFGDWTDEEADVKSLKNCLWAFSSYFREAYPLGRDRFVPYQSTREGEPAIEFSFALPIPVSHPETGMPLMYTGRFDMISVDSKGLNHPSEAKELWAQDEKTTKQMGSTWAKQWKLRGQFIGYVWAAQEYNLPLRGTLVRGICVYKRNEPKFEEAFVKVSEGVLNRWYNQMVDTASSMVETWNSGYWKQDFGESCSSYGGCGYVSMCELDNPEPFFEGRFVERRWDPLNQVEIEGPQ